MEVQTQLRQQKTDPSLGRDVANPIADNAQGGSLTSKKWDSADRRRYEFLSGRGGHALFLWHASFSHWAIYFFECQKKTLTRERRTDDRPLEFPVCKRHSRRHKSSVCYLSVLRQFTARHAKEINTRPVDTSHVITKPARRATRRAEQGVGDRSIIRSKACPETRGPPVPVLGSHNQRVQVLGIDGKQSLERAGGHQRQQVLAHAKAGNRQGQSIACSFRP